MLPLLIALLQAVAPTGSSLAQADPPPDHILVQSEIDYLHARDERVTLSFKSARPRSVLKSLARAGSFRLEIEGTFDARARASFSWKGSTVKDALTEFSKLHRVEYSVPRPDVLLVIVRDDAEEEKD